MAAVKRSPEQKRWLAYRIKGAKAEAHPDIIHAWTKEEAEQQAYAIFEAKTQIERLRVYIREQV